MLITYEIQMPSPWRMKRNHVNSTLLFTLALIVHSVDHSLLRLHQNLALVLRTNRQDIRRNLRVSIPEIRTPIIHEPKWSVNYSRKVIAMAFRIHIKLQNANSARSPVMLHALKGYSRYLSVASVGAHQTIHTLFYGIVTSPVSDTFSRCHRELNFFPRILLTLTSCATSPSLSSRLKSIIPS